jgi:hypothetical protein
MRSKNTYAEKLLDPRWQKLRLQVFERDDWKCRACGNTSKTLNAHHPVYHPHSDGPWDYEIDSIITLCSECHSDEHAELETSKANVLLTLVQMGYWGAFEMDCLCDVLRALTKDELTNLFLEKQNGSHKNN